jgi:hypothetical protein
MSNSLWGAFTSAAIYGPAVKGKENARAVAMPLQVTQICRYIRENYEKVCCGSFWYMGNKGKTYHARQT